MNERASCTAKTSHKAVRIFCVWSVTKNMYGLRINEHKNGKRDWEESTIKASHLASSPYTAGSPSEAENKIYQALTVFNSITD